MARSACCIAADFRANLVHRHFPTVCHDDRFGRVESLFAARGNRVVQFVKLGEYGRPEFWQMIAFFGIIADQLAQLLELAVDLVDGLRVGAK